MKVYVIHLCVRCMECGGDRTLLAVAATLSLAQETAEKHWVEAGHPKPGWIERVDGKVYGKQGRWHTDTRFEWYEITEVTVGELPPERTSLCSR